MQGAAARALLVIATVAVVIVVVIVWVVVVAGAEARALWLLRFGWGSGRSGSGGSFRFGRFEFADKFGWQFYFSVGRSSMGMKSSAASAKIGLSSGTIFFSALASA